MRNAVPSLSPEVGGPADKRATAVGEWTAGVVTGKGAHLTDQM
jgi:hypothetical protein